MRPGGFGSARPHWAFLAILRRDFSYAAQWYYGRAMATPFTLVFIVSAMIGLILSALPEHAGSAERSQRARPSLHRFDAAALALIFGLLGSKLLFVALQPERIQDWQTVLAPGSGALLGGLLAGAAVFCVYAWISEENILRLADGLALPGVVLTFGSWIGCALQGCAYGRRTADSWIASPGPDYLGIIEPRWPTQTAGALSALLILAALLFWIPGSAPSGLRATLTCLILGLSLTGIAALRGDPVAWLAGVRIDSLAGLTLTAFGGLIAAATFVEHARRADA